MRYTAAGPGERCTCCRELVDRLDNTYRRCPYCYENCPARGAHVDRSEEAVAAMRDRRDAYARNDREAYDAATRRLEATGWSPARAVEAERQIRHQ